MDEAFIGEIFLVPYKFAPVGFEFCNGQLLSISGNETLFSLIGTIYGGDGQTTFALPNLQGRVIVGPDSPYPLGAWGGTETKPLTAAHISNHTHGIDADVKVQMQTGTTANTSSPANAYPAPATGTPRYSDHTDEKMVAMDVSDMTTPQGAAFITDPNSTGNLPVNNMMPSLCMNYVIATQGIYPGTGSFIRTTQYLGEVMMAAFPDPPGGYVRCQGQLMSIQQNQALFSLLGTTYGGNGITTFGLPDLRGRVAIGQGAGLGLTSRVQGIPDGTKDVTLTADNLPSHTHTVQANKLSLPTGTSNDTHNPVDAFAGTTATANLYSTTTGTGVSANMPASFTINSGTPAPPLNNMQPYKVISFFTAIQGVFPSRP